MRLDQIAPALRSTVAALPIGKVSDPIIQKNGVGVIMVRDKAAQGAAQASRDEVGEALLRQRLETLARRYLRDLRLAAFVDVRV